MANILALGDCNTLGVQHLKENAYPERFAKELDKTVKNCGFTMSTTNEMLHFFEDFKENETEIILIQYGLVDSWKTFKYAPYVLYYPDNKIRKFCRKLVKKYKKVAKNIGLNKFLGVSNVVAPEAYKSNIDTILQKSQNCVVFLMNTIPNLEIYRNKEIRYYNDILYQLAQKYENVHYVDVYNDFVDKKTYYLDNTHMNEQGYAVITQKLIAIYRKYYDNKEEHV